MGLTASELSMPSVRQASKHPEADLFLDEVAFPYGPCPAVLDASAAPSLATIDELTLALRGQLGTIYRVPIESIFTFQDARSEIERIVDRTAGPIIAFPPSATATFAHTTWTGRHSLDLSRGFGKNGQIDLELASDLPSHGVAIVDSPSDPLGNLLAATDAVRVSRACELLIIDERYAEFAGHSLLPLALEFDNIVIIRSFAAWAGHQDLRCSWAVASSRAIDRFELASSEISSSSVSAGLAALENMATVKATLSLLRDERSRLYRLLRKLSFLEPLPSWGPFLAARVTIGTREVILDELRKRGVHVHAPTQPALKPYIRFGIGTRSEMDRLRTALVDLAPRILDSCVTPP